MKKKLELYFSSFKASACNKPTALLMFVMLIIVFTTAIGFPLRWILCSIEQEVFYSSLMLVNIDSTQPIDFSNYKNIAEKLLPINERGLFEESSYRSSISMGCANPNFVVEPGDVIALERVTLIIEVSPYALTQEEFNADIQTMVCGSDFLRENRLESGQRISFEGTPFVLRENLKENNANSNLVYIAYTAEFENFNYVPDIICEEDGSISKDIKFYNGGVSIYGKQNIATSYEKDILADVGLKIKEKNIAGELIFPIAIAALILAAGIASIITIYQYILKINSRRYAIYKIVGMSPMTVSSIMLSESLILSSVGVGLGLLLEVLLITILPIEGLLVSRLLWLHCVCLIAVTLLTILVTVGGKIIAHAKAVPVSAKYLQ